MSFIRKLFPSRKKSIDEKIAKMRAVINNFKLKSRNYYDKASDSRVNAKNYLKQGDTESARAELKDWHYYLSRYKTYKGQINQLEKTIESIYAAKDAEEMRDALIEANRLLKQSIKIDEDELIGIKLETEELINQIQTQQEELSRGLEEESLDESVIDKEFERLKNEVAVEESASLPAAPIETREELTEREKIKKEVEELKKSLSEEKLEEKE